MRKPRTGRRGICLRLPDGGTVNMEITGIESSVRKFDELARKIGTNRSELVRRFIEACAKENKILLPGYSEQKEEHPKTNEAPTKNIVPELAKEPFCDKPRYLFPGAEPEEPKKTLKRVVKELPRVAIPQKKTKIAGTFRDAYKNTITVCGE